MTGSVKHRGLVFLAGALLGVGLGCGAQQKQAVVASPADEEIAIEVIPKQELPALGDAGLPVVASVANLQRDLAVILERAAPQHPMAMMARMGLRAALSGTVGPELAGGVDLSAPMVAGLVQVGDESVLLLALHVLDGASQRLKEGLGTEPMAGDFVKLVGAVGGEAEMTLGQDFFCALGPEPKAVLVCSDEQTGLTSSGAAMISVLSRVRDEVALQIRYDQKTLTDAAGNSEGLDGSLAELGPVMDKLEFKGQLEQGIIELRLVPDGFEISFANLGVLGDDLLSRMLMAPPLAGEPLPPLYEGPPDTLSALTFRGFEFEPFRAELNELQALLEKLSDDPEAKQALALVRDLPWPGGPFVLAHGHDLAGAREVLDKELERKRPRQARIDAATAGYLLVGVKSPLADVTAIVRGLEEVQARQQKQGSSGGLRLAVAKRPPAKLKLPKGSLVLELTVPADAEEDGAATEGPDTWQVVVAGDGTWSWITFSENLELAAARAKLMAAGQGKLPEPGRAALRPAGVGQASMLGYLTFASAASLTLADGLEEDPDAGLQELKRALEDPNLSRLPMPMRVVIDTAADKRFRAEVYLKLPTPLVAALVSRFASK